MWVRVSVYVGVYMAVNTGVKVCIHTGVYMSVYTWVFVFLVLGFFFCFLGPHPRHMEIPRLGVELEL